MRMNTDDDTSYVVGFINVNYSVYKELLLINSHDILVFFFFIFIIYFSK